MEGFEKVYNKDIIMYTGPEWLFNMFDGYENEKKTAVLYPTIDPDGKRVLNKKSLDISKDFDVDFLIPHPETGTLTPVRDFLTEIPQCKWVETE